MIMLKLLRITCVWLYFASCIRSPFILAVPLEYIDDHEQLSYDMDTEQSRVKYDPRLLTEQMLNNAKDDAKDAAEDAAEERAFKVREEPHVFRQHHHHQQQRQKQQQQQRQKQQEQQQLSSDDDFQPHERAAACHSSGIKYTHGQKVPRLDPCEVCLCVDGEIFCWWKKCGVTRKKFKAEMHSNPKQAAESGKSKKFRVTAATTTKLTTKQYGPKSKEQQLQHVATTAEEWQQVEHEESQHAEHKEMQQKLKYHQQQKLKQNKQQQQQRQQRQQQQQRQQRQQEQQQERQMEQAEQQLQLQLQVEIKHQREHENMMRLRQQQQRERELQQTHHTSNKILSFPENLPLLLYYDYKTEEHQHHQHQHHQQHLNHQHQQERQQQQLHEQPYEQYEQQQLEESQSQHGQQPHTGSNIERTTTTPTSTTETLVYKKQQQQKSNQILFSHKAQHEDSEEEAEEEEADEEQQQTTDSDILPEPPTKKPKVTAPETIKATTTIRKTTASSNLPSKQLSEQQKAQQQQQQMPQWQEIPTTETKNSFSDNYSLRNQDDNNSNNALAETSTAATKKDSESLKNIEEMHLTVDSDVDMPHGGNNEHTTNKDGIIDPDNEDDNDDSDEDDDFHRWLSSTESCNNKSKVYGEAGFESKQTTEPKPQTPEEGVAEAETEAEEAVNPYALKLSTTSPTDNNTNSHRPPAYVQQTRSHSDTIVHDATVASSMGEGGSDAAAAGFFRSSYNDFSSEFNGSVVNIDIMLTAGQDEQQQKQQQDQRQKQAQQKQLLQSKSFVLQADLIANASNAAQIAATSTAGITAGVSGLSNNVVSASLTATTTTTMAAALLVDGTPIGSNHSSSTAATLRVASPESVTFADKQCNVMGTLYKIGDVLPQETGNCLQCICIDGGSTKDDTPRVTCSPHNCPPLVLPDLFDATGY